MCSLIEKNIYLRTIMMIEIIFFILFLKIAREGLSRIINGNLFHSVGDAY